MHSLILTDAAGAPRTPNITWADRRSAALAETLRNSPDGERFYSATGTPLHAMSPLCKLRWFEEHGGLKKFTKAISIKEYIWHKLFGVYEIDHSIASATGLFDVQALQWFRPALDYCGIAISQLSTPVSTHFVRRGLAADLASLLNIPAETPFCIGASDGCLANLGSDAVEAGTAAVTIGTSGAVRIASKQPIILFPEMLFNYRLDEHTFICGGAVNNGGNVVHWLQNFFKSPSHDKMDYETLFQLAAEAPAGSAGLLCLPYFAGERTPVWDEQASGVFAGVRPQHGPAHFIRAALEGVCFALYGVLKKLEAASGNIHTLQVSGGLVHAELWMQMLADVTGKTVCLQHTEDASATGAALLGWQALGFSKTDFTRAQQPQKKFTPEENPHGVYKNLFPIFQELYAASKQALHRLSGLVM